MFRGGYQNHTRKIPEDSFTPAPPQCLDQPAPILPPRVWLGSPFDSPTSNGPPHSSGPCQHPSILMAASQMPRMTPETSWFYVGQRDSHPTTIPTSQSPFHVFSVHPSPMATSFPERYTSPYPDQTVEMMPSVQRLYTFLWSTFCSDGSFRFAAV